MNKTRITFIDLDDTLFQTRKKMQNGKYGKIVTTGPPGKESFMTKEQEALFHMIGTGRVIATTARSREAFSRVKINFSAESIITNGAVILDPDGQTNKEWRDQMLNDILEYQESMRITKETLERYFVLNRLESKTRIVTEDGMGGIYISARIYSKEIQTPLIHKIANHTTAEANLSSWNFSLNQNHLVFYPPVVSKARAVAWLMKRFRKKGYHFFLGCGDSNSDLEFMRLCDFWMTPTQSQIDRHTQKGFNS